MLAPDEILFDPARFSGKARLFPLPNLVLFPHALLPLHIFEPRYRAMVAESLESDGLIAMALLKPGWETDYEGRPPIHSVACLAKILTYDRQDDGRYNLLMAGVARVEVVEDLPAVKPFREAKVEVRTDRFDASRAAERPAVQRRLIESFRANLPGMSDAITLVGQMLAQPVGQTLTQDVSLALIADIAAYKLELPMESKIELLAELDVDRRAAAVSAHLEKAANSKVERRRPPDFSEN